MSRLAGNSSQSPPNSGHGPSWAPYGQGGVTASSNAPGATVNAGAASSAPLQSSQQQNPASSGTAPRRSRGSRPGGRQQSTPKLMFVNYQDPTQDYKKDEHRKVIAKYAMINRKKDKLVPTKPPESKPSPTSPPRTEQNDPFEQMRHRTPSEESITTASEPSPASIADSGISGVSASHDDFSTFAASAPLADITWPSPGAASYDGSQSYDSVSGVTESNNQLVLPWRNSSYPSFPSPFSENFDTETLFSLDEPSPQASSDIGMSFNPFYFPDGFNDPDPFNSMPIHVDAQTNFLLRTYLQADRVSKAMVKNNPKIVHRIRNQRNSIWLPLVQKSATAMTALTAYVSATFDGPEGAMPCLDDNLARALLLVQNDLNDKEKSLDDSTTFAIVMLMMIAQHQGDMRAHTWHAAGLGKLLEFRRAAFDRNEARANMTFKRGLPTFDEDVVEQSEGKCLHCRDKSIRQAVSRINQSSSSSTHTDPSHISGTGFQRLIDQDLLSQDAAKFFEQVFTWCKIAEQAKMDRVAAAAAAQHAWIDGNDTSYREPFELATTSAVRLTLYLNSWLDWNHSCGAVHMFVRSVYHCLRNCNMQKYLQQCPDALMWLCLAVGPFAEGQERQWFLSLLRQVTIGYSGADFAIVRKSLLVQFLWNDSLTHAAEHFWDAARIGEYIPSNGR